MIGKKLEITAAYIGFFFFALFLPLDSRRVFLSERSKAVGWRLPYKAEKLPTLTRKLQV